MATTTPDVATTHNNMAVVYWNQGKYDETLDLYHKAEKVRVAVYGHAPGRGRHSQ